MRIIFVCIFACVSAAWSENVKPLRFLGATTVQPIIEMLRPAYKAKTQLNLLTEGGGSDKGVRYLSEHKTDIAMINRYPTEEEMRTYGHTVIGYDAIAIIVHKNNPATELTKQQLMDIFRGKTTNWKQFGGKEQEIIPVSKKSDRGTLYLFEKATGLFHATRLSNLDPDKTISTKVWEAGSNNDNIVWVGGLPAAISFVSLGNAKKAIEKGMPIKIISLDGIYPTQQSILNHTYPIVGELTLLYDDDNVNAKQFMEYILSEDGQKAVEMNRFTRASHEK